MKSLIVCSLALAISGCALTSKSEAMDVRYFTPERTMPAPTPTLTSANGAPAAAPAPVELRLGKITSGPHLRERIAYRESNHEIGYYEDRRWTERPDSYVRRALERRLFEEGGFRRVLGGTVPALDVEVLAFDEIRTPTGRAARVALRMVVFQDRTVLKEETVSIDVPVAASKDPGVDEIVAALSSALDFATTQVATRVRAAMQR